LLHHIVREIGERNEASRAAFEESRRLEAALAALDEVAGDGAGASASRPGPRRRIARRAGSRAPRGENARRIRAEIEQRPGATAGDVAAVTGIARSTVASTLGKLARGGELENRCCPVEEWATAASARPNRPRARAARRARTRTPPKLAARTLDVLLADLLDTRDQRAHRIRNRQSAASSAGA
jgi:hypothetical protein